MNWRVLGCLCLRHYRVIIADDASTSLVICESEARDDRVYSGDDDHGNQKRCVTTQPMLAAPSPGRLVW